jgi:hypothetical protein
MNEWDGNESSCSCDCGFDIPKGGKLGKLELTTPLSVLSGGTGANTVLEAQQNLGIQFGVMGVRVAGLASLATAMSGEFVFEREFKSTPAITIAPMHADFTGYFNYSIANASPTGFQLCATNITPAEAGSIPERVVYWIAIGEM